MMYHSVIKKYRYHIRQNVYQLYKIRRHGMAMVPGELDIRTLPPGRQLFCIIYYSRVLKKILGFKKLNNK